jgi:hypothetical protein
MTCEKLISTFNFINVLSLQYVTAHSCVRMLFLLPDVITANYYFFLREVFLPFMNSSS